MSDEMNSKSLYLYEEIFVKKMTVVRNCNSILEYEEVLDQTFTYTLNNFEILVSMRKIQNPLSEIIIE